MEKNKFLPNFFQAKLQRFMQETLFFHFDISQKLKPLVFCLVAWAEIGRKWRPKPWTLQLPPSSGRIGQVCISPAVRRETFITWAA